MPKEVEAMIPLDVVNSQVGGQMIQNAMLITEISNKGIDILSVHFQTNLDLNNQYDGMGGLSSVPKKSYYLYRDMISTQE